MKELTIEEKAKAYDKAIAYAKKLSKTIGNATLGNLVLKNEFENMFPELKESDDEKVRKHLISLFEKFVTLGVANECETSEIKVDDILAWLEKQGEKKFVWCKEMGSLLIDKSALVAEIENLENTYKKCQTRNSYEEGLKEGRLIGYKDALYKINSLEVCPINNINIEEVKAIAKAWSEDDENTHGCDYIGAAVAERAFVAGAEWLINKTQKGE